MNKNFLKESTQKLLPEWMPEDLSKTIDDTVIFFTHIYKDGSLLGFWSHSPWGTTRNQEEGWMVVSKEGKSLEWQESKIDGISSGYDIRKWKRDRIQEHGKSIKLMEEHSRELIWKITEC